MIRAWRLDSDVQTIVFASFNDRLPCVIHWGSVLPEQENLKQLADATRMDQSGGMMDEIADLSICPEELSGFQGQPGLFARRADGTPIRSQFRLQNAASGKELVFDASDANEGLEYTAKFQALPSGAIRAQCWLKANKNITVDWIAAPVMPASQLSDKVHEFSGRWCGEFQRSKVAWHAGARLREARGGRTGHENCSGVIVPDRGATHRHGRAFGLSYGWSGGHKMLTEELQDGRRQIQFGRSYQSGGKAGQAFQSDPLYLAYSTDGLNGVANRFHATVRREFIKFPDPGKKRPVHYNCWEAVYFEHNLDDLKIIAAEAAELGAERFVLDDGWFKGRNDDTTSLGDWVVDKQKFPDGLTPLIDCIHGLGMTFGLWFEPEMVNFESDLFKHHPDWVLGPVPQPLGRNQMVLDLSKSEVKDHLIACISGILKTYPIDYIKWDHNRPLPFQTDAQTEGTYEVLDAIRSQHPQVEIESCASGGGRVDYGILEHAHRVWLSDSNDALERLKMQAEAAQFLPNEIVGSHVGPRVCHTSGRTHSMAFRAWVAATRHMGFEMNPNELTDDEAETLRSVTAWWKSNRDWLFSGPHHRLDATDPSVIAELRLAANATKFVVFVGKTDGSAQSLSRPLLLAGLDDAVRYKVTMTLPDGAVSTSRACTKLDAGPITLTGQSLMEVGLQLPVQNPASMIILEGERVR